MVWRNRATTDDLCYFVTPVVAVAQEVGRSPIIRGLVVQCGHRVENGWMLTCVGRPRHTDLTKKNSCIKGCQLTSPVARHKKPHLNTPQRLPATPNKLLRPAPVWKENTSLLIYKPLLWLGSIFLTPLSLKEPLLSENMLDKKLQMATKKRQRRKMRRNRAKWVKAWILQGQALSSALIRLPEQPITVISLIDEPPSILHAELAKKPPKNSRPLPPEPLMLTDTIGLVCQGL